MDAPIDVIRFKQQQEDPKFLSHFGGKFIIHWVSACISELTTITSPCTLCSIESNEREREREREGGRERERERERETVSYM